MGPLCLLSLLLVLAIIGVLGCIIDDNCATGYTCLEGTCTECLTCNLIFRKGNSCVVDFGECGECLEGFSEVAITTDTNYAPCEPASVVKHEAAPSWDTFLAIKASAVALIVVSTVFFTTFLVIWIRKRYMHKIVSHSQILPSAPPLHEMDIQRTIGKCQFIPQLTRTDTCVPIEKEQRQQARVFKEPDALYYTMGEEWEDGPPTGYNSCINCTLCAGAESAQQRPSYFSASAFIPRLDGLIEHDSTDSSAPAANEVNIDRNDSSSRDFVALDVENAAQVTESPSQETADPDRVAQSVERKET